MVKRSNESKEPELIIRVPEHVSPGVYSNLVKISVSSDEVIFDFVLVSPNPGENATLVSRVILSKRHASALLEVLDKLIKSEQEREVKK